MCKLLIYNYLFDKYFILYYIDYQIYKIYTEVLNGTKLFLIYKK